MTRSPLLIAEEFKRLVDASREHAARIEELQYQGRRLDDECRDLLRRVTELALLNQRDGYPRETPLRRWN